MKKLQIGFPKRECHIVFAHMLTTNQNRDHWVLYWFDTKSKVQIPGDTCCLEVPLPLFQQRPEEESVQEPRWRPGSLVLHYRSLCALGVLQCEEMQRCSCSSTSHQTSHIPEPAHSCPGPFHCL